MASIVDPWDEYNNYCSISWAKRNNREKENRINCLPVQKRKAQHTFSEAIYRQGYDIQFLLLSFSKKIRLGISCDSSARPTIHMKCEALFSLKNIKKKKKKKNQKSAAVVIGALRIRKLNIRRWKIQNLKRLPLETKITQKKKKKNWRLGFIKSLHIQQCGLRCCIRPPPCLAKHRRHHRSPKFSCL